MADLLLDLPTLATLHGELVEIGREFDNAKPVRAELDGAVGDVGGSVKVLSGKVDEFSKGWDIRRHKITDAMNAIAVSIAAIHDTFVEVDTKLAAALTQGD
jgi:hypothetical protein